MRSSVPVLFAAILGWVSIAPAAASTDGHPKGGAVDQNPPAPAPAPAAVDAEVTVIHASNNADAGIDPRIGKLPPRLRPVLKHFVEGDSEKQVAAKLGLSKHTVHEYAKILYRQLGVSSRGELLAQFVGKVG